MTIPLLSRQQFEVINRRTLRYPLAVAEKDYFLALALQTLYTSPLKDILIFKGGTALHHCHLPQHRFSEDLDFTALRSDLTAAEVTSALETNNLFTIKKVYESAATIKIARLQYQGVLGQPGSIKVEIDHMQNVVLPPQELTYRNVWDVPISLPVMNISEVCAEKIRATSQRSRYRDFYDLYLIFDTFMLNLDEIIALLRQKEIRQPIRQSSILANWQVAQEQQANELNRIYCTKTITNTQIEEMIAELKFADIS